MGEELYKTFKCNHCGETKNINEFRKGHGHICKQCENEKNKIRYKERNYYQQYKDRLNRYFVYRLIKDNEIIYVGRTNSFIKRMQSHKLDKDFDKIEILTFDNPIDMQIAELYFISKYKTILNKKDKNCKDSMAIYELDILAWREVDYTNIIENRDIPVDVVTNITANDKTVILLKDIKYIFVRKRSKKYLVYVELENKKQKLIKSFEDKKQANDLADKIQNLKNQKYINSVAA